jgi:hypothetical protein
MAIELIFNIILGAGIVFFMVETMALPAGENPNDIFGASGFPEILSVLALIVLIFITVNIIREKKHINIPMFDLRSQDGRKLVVSVLLLAGYVALLNYLGFCISTLLYLFSGSVAIGYRKWLTLTIFSVVTTVVLVAVFGSIFYVPLPRGVGILRELSYMIY